MKAILGIVFFVLFGLAGARFAGFVASALLEGRRFESPDQVAQFTTITEFSVTIAIALIGLFVGLWLAVRLKPLLIHKQN